jgi:hypothetical protein
MSPASAARQSVVNLMDSPLEASLIVAVNGPGRQSTFRTGLIIARFPSAMGASPVLDCTAPPVELNVTDQR